MNFAFDEDDRALRESVLAVLSGTASLDTVRACHSEPDAWRAQWKQLVELGWSTLIAPEPIGAGLGMVELVAVFELCGEHLLAAPLTSTAGLVGTLLLGAAGDAEAADAVEAVWRRLADGAVATLIEPAPRRDGTTGAERVPDAERADLFAVLDPAADPAFGRTATILPRTAVVIDPVRCVDPSRPCATVTVPAAAAAEPVAVLACDEPAAARRWVALAAEAVGVAAGTLRRICSYVRDREQFGRPIGSFQAVQHRAADCLVQVERARSLVYRAAVVLDRPVPAPVAEAEFCAHLAKAAASEAAIWVAKSGVQLHGAIATTWDHDMHLYLRRARELATYGGTARAHYAAAGARYLAEGPEDMEGAEDTEGRERAGSGS